MASVNARSYATVDTPVDEEPYWQRVSDALREVLGQDREIAQEQIENLRAGLRERPLEEQILFLHDDPLNVAGRLAEKEISEEEVTAYRRLTGRY